MTTFTDLGLPAPLLKALAAEGYETPTPIQAQSIPHLLKGSDLLGVAQTGTGKTAAFALPMLTHLDKINRKVRAVANGIDVVVATPGRLLDLLDQRAINLGEIELFVLDEADRMLDMGFIRDIRRILTKLPARRQTMFFSATMPKEISDLAGAMLTAGAAAQAARRCEHRTGCRVLAHQARRGPHCEASGGRQHPG